MLTEFKINKLLNNIWQSTSVYPSSFYLKSRRPKNNGVVFIRGKVPYKVIRGKFQRVYKKYNWKPKPRRIDAN